MTTSLTPALPDSTDISALDLPDVSPDQIALSFDGAAEPADTAPVADAPAEPAAPTGPTFHDLSLDPLVVRALDEIGYRAPSPIQAETIPALIAGHDVLGVAQTGTGKTAAFALPMLSAVDLDENTPQGLVLAPTRELALQVGEAVSDYARHLKGLRVLPIYGGQSYGPQLAGLRRGPHIVVGTPGRIIDHLQRGSLDLSQLKYLVLDEADEMLRMGFHEDVEQILAGTPETKQVALFSATMPAGIRRIAENHLNHPVEVRIKSKTTTAPNIRQRYVEVTGAYKLEALTRILEVEDYEAVIVFVRTKQNTEELAEQLQARGLAAQAINGDVPQNQRERSIERLREGDLDILVATDVAARGLDVERISHVVNYDIPHDTESYVHRIGRTGRAGRDGDAIVFVTPRERRFLSQVERATHQPVAQMPLPDAAAVNERRVAKFHGRIATALESRGLDAFRGVVASFVESHDATVEDVAAALASLAHGEQKLFVEDLPEAARRSRPRRDRDDRGYGDSADRRGGEGRRRPRSSGPRTIYRIDVGRQHRVRPAAIVGAIANEGGIPSADIGHIDIRGDFSLVELPSELPQEAWRKLKRTRVAGQQIHLAVDQGRPGRPGRPNHRRDDRRSRD